MSFAKLCEPFYDVPIPNYILADKKLLQRSIILEYVIDVESNGNGENAIHSL